MLRELDIPYVALNPGASYRGLHDSLVNLLGNRDPQMLLCLHEEHAVAMAHGYAKVTGRPMGAIVHSNVGLMHATMAIFNAWCDRTPVVVLGATGPVDAAKRRPWIDWIHTAQDQGALIRNYTKWDDQPASVAAAAESMLRAHRMAVTPPCGPVYICLDAALQESRIGELPPLPSADRFRPPRPIAPDPAALQEAAALLQNAERPLILVGRVAHADAEWQRRIKFAEALGAVVLTDAEDRRRLPVLHKLQGPPAGNQPSDAACELIRAADVVLNLDWVDLAGALKDRLGRRAGRQQGHLRLARPSRAQWLEHGLPGPGARRSAPARSMPDIGGRSVAAAVAAARTGLARPPADRARRICRRSAAIRSRR